MLATNFLGAGGYLLINNENKLGWSVWPGEVQKSFPVVEVREDALPRKPKNLALTIEAEYNQNMEVKNVLGFIPGTTAADTFLVFTAHYDHLGRMGSETYFPGANDNASGIAMMLDLARYFSKSANQQKYSIAFIALAGEELGLKGSTYFVENPFFPLENIRFLINLDMVGTGSEGITVVNGAIYPEAFALLDSINGANNYLVKVASRGESCNSDHCPFYQKGVPSIFIYSRGMEYLEYHNIYDLPQNLPFTEYDDIFRLLRDFIKIY
jgi:Zn-dependent M28 family amino/carboxypeptidase